MNTEQTILANTLTPKFYVALTGTSSLISGLILIFEWWYFRKYGTSFIEQVSINHISPWLNGNDTQLDQNSNNSGTNNNDTNSGNSSTSENSESQQQLLECKVWRNPYNLFRGAEYQRFFWATSKEPLTYYDMNLSAQDHQTFFTCEGDAGKEEYEIMQTAWRERNPIQRIKSAQKALEINAECTPAYILLAEEEATTIVEVEKIFKNALKIAEVNYRRSQVIQHLGPIAEGTHRRDTNVLIYIRRRLAMCARKLGRLKEAAKMFRDLTKEIPSIMNVLSVHENLIETLLEMKLYVDCQNILSRFDDYFIQKSATVSFTIALLKTRAMADKQSTDMTTKSKKSAEEQAIEAIKRAIEFNPHVPIYLLETKAFIFPPEHILKRGDSEAIAYAFFHLKHWKNVDGALDLLHQTWQRTYRHEPPIIERTNTFYPYATCTECADRELLPQFHELSVCPSKDLPFFVVFTAGLFFLTAILALLTNEYPDTMGWIAQILLHWLSYPYQMLNDFMDLIYSCLPTKDQKK